MSSDRTIAASWFRFTMLLITMGAWWNGLVALAASLIIWVAGLQLILRRQP